MARIALVIKNFRPSVLSLAQSLSSQHNDVFFITDSKTAESAPQMKFRVLAPFKTWSARETVKLLPHLLNQMPDVLHFVYSSPEEQPTLADWLLSRMLQPIPRRAVTASFFYSPREAAPWRLRRFLKGCHAVTWGSHVHMLQAKRDHSVPSDTLLEVIPPMSSHSDSADNQPHDTENSADLQRLIRGLGRYLAIPGSSSEFFASAREEELFFEQKLNFLFLGSRKLSEPLSPANAKRCFFLNSQSEQDVGFAIENSLGLLLAFNDLSLLELQTLFQWSQSTSTPLIVSPKQNALFAGLVRPGKTGWVLEQGEVSLRALLRDNPELPWQPRLDENPNLNLVDSASNQLNRLFAQAISLRS